ncbi:hypothetical protein [Micromonospora radicis]|uniref:Uncharacterized protein n=1 Tax=Micromonospora radicis TaxID=1894971 RepID=A0A418MY64_9ACTN|nr:hypothetical protein [Micromonospora radicis]RIV40073.1 hypothetical protein D2L64_07080 [Micromonospora radicis]
MARRVTAVLVGLGLVVSGCAVAAEQPRRRDSGVPVVQQRWESCDTVTGGEGLVRDGSQDALALPLLDDDFRPSAAVVCRAEPQRRPGGGTDLVAMEERAADVAALVAALRLPDRPTVGNCTLELPFVPWLALLDAQGRWVRPGVPTDDCGKPRIEFRTAYEQLSTERVATRVLRELESDAAAASGCSQDWADMVWATGEFGGGQGTVPDPLAPGSAAVRVCVYQVPVPERGGDKPAGEFESGRTLSAAQWTEVGRELVATAPAASCDTPAGRFAVLHLPTGQVYVEADGCRRILIEVGNGPGALRQGTAGLAGLVFAP